MRPVPAIAPFSLLSAIGALPFLMLPVLTGSASMAGGEAVKAVALIAILMTVGELLASVLSPLLFGGRFSVQQATLTAMVFAGLFMLSGIELVPGSAAVWAAIGFASGMLQYFGTIAAVLHGNPTNASQFRLAVSLLVSGGAILATATHADLGYETVKFIIAGAVFAVALLIWAMLQRARNVFEEPRIGAEVSAPSSGTRLALAYGSLFLFFAVVPPYFSALPELAAGQYAGTTLVQLGFGKVLAAPLLYVISTNYRIAASRFAAPAFGLALAGAVALISVSPSVAAFVLLEIGVNGSVSILFGRHGSRLRVAEKRWFFLCVQAGSIVGFAALAFLSPARATTLVPLFAALVPLALVLTCIGPGVRPDATSS